MNPGWRINSLEANNKSESITNTYVSQISIENCSNSWLSKKPVCQRQSPPWLAKGNKPGCVTSSLSSNWKMPENNSTCSDKVSPGCPLKPKSTWKKTKSSSGSLKNNKLKWPKTQKDSKNRPKNNSQNFSISPKPNSMTSKNNSLCSKPTNWLSFSKMLSSKALLKIWTNKKLSYWPNLTNNKHK